MSFSLLCFFLLVNILHYLTENWYLGRKYFETFQMSEKSTLLLEWQSRILHPLTFESISYNKSFSRMTLSYVWQCIYYLFNCVLLVLDRILLRDVKALTLHHDRYTTSRRLDPIPQLKCVGGTAGCDSYTPKVIQCQNKGWDGYDVQVIFIMLMTVELEFLFNSVYRDIIQYFWESHRKSQVKYININQLFIFWKNILQKKWTDFKA